METTKTPPLPKLLIALAIYITSLIASNTLGLKLMPFLFGTHVSVAIFCFPVVFLMTDMIGEVYGKSYAKLFVKAGFVATVLFLLFTIASLVVPWSDSALWVKDGYDQVFGLSIRIAIASVCAFLIGELQDVWSFFFFTNKLGKKNFWLRSNLSNAWSQLIDTVLFMMIAFVGVYSLKTIAMIIIPWWLYKVVMGIAYTPLSYIGLRWLKDKSQA